MLVFQYYYSIKDISVGGMCICYGHAKACPLIPNTKVCLIFILKHFFFYDISSLNWQHPHDIEVYRTAIQRNSAEKSFTETIIIRFGFRRVVLLVWVVNVVSGVFDRSSAVNVNTTHAERAVTAVALVTTRNPGWPEPS